MKLSIFLLALLCVLAASAQRVYYFQTLSSPEFDGPADQLEQPLRSTRTVIFSIDEPLFRDTYFDSVSGLDSFDDDDTIPPIGFAGPIPDFKTSDAGSITASIALIVASIALFI